MFRKQVAHTFKVVFEREPDGSAWKVSIPSLEASARGGRKFLAPRPRRGLRAPLPDGSPRRKARDGSPYRGAMIGGPR
jgi:hypothetical protein